jgi:hypothetical protein
MRSLAATSKGRQSNFSIMQKYSFMKTFQLRVSQRAPSKIGSSNQ